MNLNEFRANVPSYVDKAIETGRSITGGKAELKPSMDSIGVLDAVVAYAHELWKKKQIDDDVAWDIAVSFGVLLGEMMIREHELYWTVNEEGIPVVAKGEKHTASPITKLYRILTDEDDIEESPSAFCEAFSALLRRR